MILPANMNCALRRIRLSSALKQPAVAHGVTDELHQRIGRMTAITLAMV
jgi:hypothetical protein